MDRSVRRAAVLLALGLAWGCDDEPASIAAQVCLPDGEGGVVVRTVRDEATLASYLEVGGAVLGAGLDDDCTGGLRVRVDPDLVAPPTVVAAPAGGAPRPVGAVAGAGDAFDVIVAGEVEVRFPDARARDRFLTRYGATVVRDDTVVALDADGDRVEVAGGMGGWHLVRIDPARSGLVDLPARALALGFEGELRFSDEATMRTLAAVFRERDRAATPNFVGALDDALNEHPTSDSDPTSYADWSTRWWMSEDDDPSTPEDDGLSIGVAAAFEYLRGTGLPGGTWQPARVAIVDVGFDLDPDTGLGNRDYGNDPTRPPLQLDLVDYDGRPGGPATGVDPWNVWHGQKAFGVAAAYPRNGFGGAGTGGEYVRPILIRTDLTSSNVAAAIRTAALSQAAAINLSLGSTCPFLCDTVDFFEGAHVQEAIDLAVDLGSVVVASAGNGPDNDGTQDYDIDDGDQQVYCELPNVLCVGAIDQGGDNVWNHGSAVDLWAPTGIRSTVAPDTATMSGIAAVSRMGGTSCSAPFVSGVVGLMKAADPSLRWTEITEILRETANAGPATDGIRTRYVDAYRAVAAVRENPAPVVAWSSHTDGARIGWQARTRFAVTVSDEPALFGFEGEVRIESDRDGVVCETAGEGGFHECRGPLSPGAHALSAVAVDRFGAEGRSGAIGVEVVNQAPVALVLSPEDGASRFTSQEVPLRGQVTDLDGETFETSCATAADDEACAAWSSSVDGALEPPAGTSALDFRVRLSEGEHTLTLTARDGAGTSASDTVTITVVRGAGVPTAIIATPDLAWPNARGEFALRGSATDPEDGTLTGAALAWYSDVDGFLGNGAALDVALTGPSGEGIVEHRVRLVATDGDGNTGEDSIRLQVIRIE